MTHTGPPSSLPRSALSAVVGWIDERAGPTELDKSVRGEKQDPVGQNWLQDVCGFLASSQGSYTGAHCLDVVAVKTVWTALVRNENNESRWAVVVAGVRI